ncbi:GNAT family N-acetyltransferase [Rhodobacteraceae bacterium RKSG542]|uniref:GNAT family N-acetyltransferase n=1 Tax=Pseudovibrio flavus TaxID=2529854 RepID=UPI0012BC594F|nr:GNAT family N-acetyltransferase [Pseudovibrio flavus]MTI16001.1 GNAT family N-acetyltransferase [Pseudovibrio flavus]
MQVVRLGQVQWAVEPLVQLFQEAWPQWYGEGGNGDAGADLSACLSPDTLPIAFVALSDDGRVIGTAALKHESLGSELGFGPWLAAMAVSPSERGRGVGSALVAAVETAASELGFDAIYTSTDEAARLITRLGWEDTGRRVQSQRGSIAVFRRSLVLS